MGNLALVTLKTVKIVPLAEVPLFTIDTKQDHAICQAVSAITTLAILNKSVLHIFADYTPHTSFFIIKVAASNTNYRGEWDYILTAWVDLDNANALDLLMQMEDSLIDLIATAKDKSTGAV